MKTKDAALVSTLILSAAVASALHGEVTLPDLFSAHAVLQKAAAVPVWGKAEPGSTIRATIAGESKTTTADQQGRWRVEMDLSAKAPGPFSLVVEGTNRVVVPDVLIGEVWICSGQSNMDWCVSRTTDADAAIAASSRPQLRIFEPKHLTSDQPLDEIHGTWLISGPDVAGRFPAVGYHFGKDLQQALAAPVGLISTSWGGTPVEAWTSREALQQDPDLREGSDRVIAEQVAFPARVNRYAAQLRAWEQKYQIKLPVPADPAAFAGADVSLSDWTPITLPGNVAQAGLPEGQVVWIRRQINITPAMTVGPLFLELGLINDFDTVYLNGRQVGETPYGAAGGASARTYYLEKTTSGEVTLAIRIVAPIGRAAAMGPEGAFRVDRESLAGKWWAKVETPLPELSAEARRDYPTSLPAAPAPARTPSYVYNSMLHSVIPYAIQGVVWYQGEDNGPRAYQYRTAFPLMISDWRQRWGQGSFAFYFCQLANFGSLTDEPGDSRWAELREAQTRTLALANTGQAILLDLGEPGDIHPRSKTEAGARLARIALANTYRRAVAFSGPVYQSFTVEEDTIRIHFGHADGGLAAHLVPATLRMATVDTHAVPLTRHSPESPLEGFAICGADRKWKWAKASIDGSTVVVRGAGVSQPVAVRYNWADSPIGNLYNGEGLPAGPFRTDDFPGLTDQQRLGLPPLAARP
ncbi:MAG: acetylesterase [Verrucomicrobia bacterium]|nr:acetylesterase [Verrucomicrobiota bacterium]